MHPGPPLRLWHGGAPGRRVGDLLLPPSQTGVISAVLQMSLEAGMADISQRPDRVYVTTDRHLAEAWAGVWTPDGAKHGGGALYRVEAEDLEPDEDLLSLTGVSFQTAQARVSAVYNAHVPFHSKYAKVLQRMVDAHAAAKAQRMRGDSPW
jgi:hypothetical protein